MNRRNFLNKLGLGAVACAVVPIVIKEEELVANEEALKEAPRLVYEGKPYGQSMEVEEVMRIWKETGMLVYKV